MSKFSIVLCIALFASAVSADFMKPNLVALQSEAIRGIDRVISNVKEHVFNLDFGGFLNTTIYFSRVAWERNSRITQEAFEQIVDLVADRANISEFLKLHTNLVEDTKAVILKTKECMVNKSRSSHYFDYFPMVYEKAYIPELERLQSCVVTCNATLNHENVESIATAIICIQEVEVTADIFTNKLMLELRNIHSESEAISKKIEDCAREGLSSLDDKRSLFIQSFVECKNRTISSS